MADAIQCAVEIQREVETRNAALPKGLLYRNQAETDRAVDALRRAGLK